MGRIWPGTGRAVVNHDRQAMFAAALRRVLMSDSQYTEQFVVCMICKKLTKSKDVYMHCCKHYSFLVDTKSVVIDKTTGEVTHAAPLIKQENFKNA